MEARARRAAATQWSERHLEAESAKGKQRFKAMGKLEVSQEACMAVLELNQ